MPLQTGSLLNQRYRIDEVIAQGGMGAIYAAYDQILNLRVAIKENFLPGEEHVRQFYLEANILATLRHPNLPRVTDHFTVPGSGQYLVMDYIEGTDLRQWMKTKGKLEEIEVLQIGIEICNALIYLHTRQPPILHRDIKPGNIRLTPTGQVLLVDFGLAKRSPHGEKTTTGAQALTPGYAPPEQYGQGTDPRSDIYALGATLYAVLTGMIPEDGLARAMGSVELTPIVQHNPHISPITAQVIEKAMAVFPNDRYPSAQVFQLELKKALEMASRGVENSAPSPPPEQDISAKNLPSPSPRSFLRKVGLPLSLAGMLLGLTVAGIFALKPLATPLPTPETTQAATEMTTNDQNSFSGITTSSISTRSPTDTPVLISASTPHSTPTEEEEIKLAFVSDRTGTPQIWSIHPNGSSPQQITHLPEGACQPDWHPHDDRLVFISPCRDTSDEHPGAGLFMIHADGTGLTPLPTLPGGDFDPAWSPDGQTIAFSSIRNGRPNLFLIHLPDFTQQQLSSPVNSERHPAWSPDGKFLAYETSRSGFRQVWIMQSDGKNTRAFTDNRSALPAWTPDGQRLAFLRGTSALFVAEKPFNEPMGEENPLTEPVVNLSNPVFSPDGTWLALDRIVEGNRDLYLVNYERQEWVRLTNDPAADFDPAWR